MSENSIYQFRFYIKGISPQIWRKLQLKGDNTLEDFHHSIQMTLGWANYHLHQINIRGKTYGVYKGYLDYSEDACKITIKSLNLKINEKFLYEYNFNSYWEIEVRLEKILEPVNGKKYPLCISGARAGPPEDCGGSESYMRLDEYYTDYKIIEIFANEYQALDEDEDLDSLREVIADLKYWSYRNKFDKKEANVLLGKFANNDPDWEDYMDEVLYL